jgi:predicted DCC family thiol-disulfide oxidoreductase YuxK
MITVYYDGLCKVCSKEINHYRKQSGADSISFVDICSSNFDARAEGLDPARVHQVMHVRRQDGTLAVKVDAFIEIWSVLPRFKWLAKAARWSPVNAGLNLGYVGFTMIRPFLPRYANPADCQESPYCDVKVKE